MQNPIKVGILAVLLGVAADISLATQAGGTPPQQPELRPAAPVMLKFPGGTLSEFAESLTKATNRAGGSLESIIVRSEPTVRIPDLLLQLNRNLNQRDPQALINVEFQGGTVAEYVAAVRTAADKVGTDVNVVVPADAQVITVPPLSMRGVSVQTSLTSLASAFPRNSAYWFEVRAFSQSVDEAESFAIEFENRTRPGMVVQPGMSGQLPAQAKPGTVLTEVFTVRDIIEAPPGFADTDSTRLSKDNLLRAVDAAFSLQGVQDVAPEVLFHAESGLLIVRGAREQVELAKAILERIGSDLSARRARALNVDTQRLANKRQLAELQNRRESLEVQLEIRQQLLDTLTERQAAGSASEEEVQGARLEYLHAKLQLDSTKIEIEGMVRTLVGAEVNKPKDVRYLLKNVAATDAELLKEVRRFLSDRGSVTVDATANSWVVQASEEDQSTVAKVIGYFDTKAGAKK